VSRRLAIVLAGFYAAWVGAWLFKLALASRGLVLQPAAEFAYWTGLKLIIWVAPAVLLLGGAAGTGAPHPRWRSTLAWGLGAGLALGLLGVGQHLALHEPLMRWGWSWAALNALCVAPIVEEVFFRGAVFRELLERHRFWAANALTAALFVAAHVPGWAFMGTLAADPLGTLRLAVVVFWLGLVFGYVRHRSGSVASSVVAHALGNLFS
jgi:membrane protease YdiL (CAAX protease family)